MPATAAALRTAVLVLLLVGCGSGPTTTLVMTDFAYEPATVVVPGDGSHTLTVVNDSGIFHDLTVEDLPADAAPVHLGLFEDSSAPYRLPALPAGTYTIYCSIDGHREAGMEGTLVVTP
jgi:plastocyanin